MTMKNFCKTETDKHGNVSVIMPVYNESPEVLMHAIRSILSQTLPADEFIICDDGSNEKTKRFLNRLQTEHGIRVMSNSRKKGAAGARNHAILHTSCRYIAFMDADDISAPDRLRKEYEFLEKNIRYGFVGGKGEYFHQKPGDMKEDYWYVPFPEPKDFLMTLPFVHASLMIRREALESVGGYREMLRVKRSEDYDLMMRLYEAGYKGANLKETVYYIRHNRELLKRRKYRYRFQEAAVKFEGFIRLGLMPKGVLFAVKPFVVGLLPGGWIRKWKRRYYGARCQE